LKRYGTGWKVFTFLAEFCMQMLLEIEAEFFGNLFFNLKNIWKKLKYIRMESGFMLIWYRYFSYLMVDTELNFVTKLSTKLAFKIYRKAAFIFKFYIPWLVLHQSLQNERKSKQFWNCRYLPNKIPFLNWFLRILLWNIYLVRLHCVRISFHQNQNFDLVF